MMNQNNDQPLSEEEFGNLLIGMIDSDRPDESLKKIAKVLFAVVDQGSDGGRRHNLMMNGLRRAYYLTDHFHNSCNSFFEFPSFERRKIERQGITEVSREQ